jgi:hypothetical protein
VFEIPSERVKCLLDDIGVRHGSELSSLSRDVLRTWECFLVPLRGQTFDLLQIGVRTGASLRTWREWFPEAQLIGLDARRLVLDPPIADSTIVQGNPTDLGALQPLLRDRRFRLIVDDGSRHPDDQVQTFQLLFPWLEPNSLYICAGVGERMTLSMEPPAQPEERPERAADLRRHWGRRPEQPTGLAWFADVGRALTASDRRDRHALLQPTREFILRKASGVTLLPGSVVVTS